MDFEKFVDEIKSKIFLKSTLEENDIVIILVPDIVLFGVVTKIERDMSKKIDWWHVSFTTLTIPMKQYKWIMRTEQMTGEESFTMDDAFRFFCAVDIPEEVDEELKELSKVTKTKLTLVRKKDK